MAGYSDKDNNRDSGENWNRNSYDEDSREPVAGSSPDNEQKAHGEGNAREGDNQGSHWFDELETLEEEPSEYTGRGERRRNHKKARIKKTLLAAGGVLMLLLIGVGVYAYSFFSDMQEPQRILLDEASFEDDPGYEVDSAFSDRIVNIALLGFDRGWGREKIEDDLFRPDAIGVFSIDFATGEVSVVRITRDAYVPIYGMGGMHDKINHSYRLGYQYGDSEDSHKDGIKYTLNTISHTLGDIPIHYYVSVDMYSVIELVDAVGGIYYEVEETIYDKHYEVGRVLVPEGPQIMDGKTYLRYLQYRDDATDQDYGRIDRQMSLLKQTLIYLRDQGKLSDIPSIYRIYKDYVETDLNYTQIAALAYFARDLDMNNFNVYVLPGDGQTKDGVWYQVLKQEERLEIIKEVFGVEAEKWPPIVLEDSPEYIEEQERLRREEERDRPFEERDFPFNRNDNESGPGDEAPEEEAPEPVEEPGEPGESDEGTGEDPYGSGEEEPADEECVDGDPDPGREPAEEGDGGNDNW